MGISLPIDFETRMRGQLGAEYESYVTALEAPMPTSIRLNPHKNSALANTNDMVSWEPQGRYLAERPVFTLDPLLHAGAYYVQEASSMFAGYALRQIIGNETNIRILDLCAAPGGKSTHYASLIGDKGLLVCNEVISNRVPTLCENLTKWGCPNAVVTNNDPSDFGRLGGFFDVVAVDAPCSGEGMFRRDAVAVSEWSVANTRICAQRQQRIVADVWDALKPGGYLIYSTCTFCPDEDENLMSWIASEFGAENIAIDIKPEWNITPIEKDGCVGYRFIQHKTRGEGFFCCVFRKNDGSSASSKKLKNKIVPVPQKLIPRLQEMTVGTGFEYYLKNDTAIAVPQAIATDVLTIADSLTVRKMGTAIAHIFGDKLAPEHDLALSWALNRQAFNAIELPLPDALRYLHRDNVFVADAAAGFNLVTYNNLPLGWIKNIGNRWNNLYPQNWKIRMNVE
ncbi:MAG: rRNA cytosine-C5-methyltransferase [Salinivirgaceae bacterium]|nr:rRNA cytosine-C5-methyltransferase [Salinivirgaceae bacterium]